MHGTNLAGHEIRGEVLPVDYDKIRRLVPNLIETHRPAAVISLGL